MRESELAKALDAVWEKSSARNWILGRLGTETGTPEEIDVPGRSGYVVVSMGSSGDQGITIAKDKVGVDKIVFQLVRMRRELGELVIREASAYAGGNGSGTGGDALDDLSDVALSSVTDGQVLTYSSEIGQWRNEAAGAGMGMTNHPLTDGYHTGLLNWNKLNFVGSSLANIETRNHSDLQGITANQHHPHVHPVVGTDALGVAVHTASGLTTGWVLRANGATVFNWGALLHTEIDPASITADQHHDRSHDIILGDGEIGAVHTITGNAFDVVGATGFNTLGLLTPTHNPGATERLLKTSSDGSLFLDTNLLYVDALYNRIGINRATAIVPESGAALDIVIGSNLNDHTQRIKQQVGQLGRLWRIENTDGDELIVLDSVGNLQSGRPGYVSGMTGWQISPGGNAEFNNIWARGELHATVFVKDEIHAIGGSILVATAGKLHADAEIDAGTIDSDTLQVDSNATAYPGTETLDLTIETTVSGFGTTLTTQSIGNRIEIDDPPSGEGLYFQPGEILRVKTEINEIGNPLKLSDVWLEVMSGTQQDGFSTYAVTKRSGSDCTIPAGTAIVSYGMRGDGRILMTSDWRKDDGYAPYIDVFTTGNEPWNANDPTAIVPRMRMGQLKGVGVPGTTIPGPGDGIVGITGFSQYGIIMGSDLTNANSGYLIASDREGIRLHKVPMTLNNGTADTGRWSADGNLRIGKDVSADATTGFRVVTTGDNAGDVWIGNSAYDSNNYLRWDQFNGVLHVKGALSISGGGTGYVTENDMNLADEAVLDEANDYTDALRTDSTAYVNNRTISKVTGTWNSASANIMAWGSTAIVVGGEVIKIHFANGSFRTIANGQTPTLSTRAYLFVNVVSTTHPANLDVYLSYNENFGSPDWTLIAVIDPGNPRASVNVVAGGTYISGGNIFTGSVHADRLVANSITANQVDSVLYTTIATRPETNARRVAAVYGLWTPGAVNSQSISWSSMVIRYGDGRSQNINANTFTFGGAAASWTYAYFYVDLSNTSAAQSFVATDNINLLTSNQQAIAIVRRSTASGYVSVTVLVGITLITGDSIVTGSIIADNIASNAVTANKINVNGNIAIAAGGSINGNGKTYGDTGAPNTKGFFLGHNGSAYVFDIGDNNSYLRWSGATLNFRTVTPIVISAEASNQVLQFVQSGFGSQGILRFNASLSTGGSAYEMDYNFDFRASNVHAVNTLFAHGNSIVIQTPAPPSSMGVSGTPGEIRWNWDGSFGYLYLYTGSGTGWRRVQFTTF